MKLDLRPRKLDLYLGGRYLLTFGFTVGLLVLVIIVIDLSEKIGDIVEHDTPIRGLIFEYYFNFIPWIINVLSPIFIFISVIFFTANLTQRTEVVAILSSGISFNRFLRPYMVVGGGLALLFFYLNGWVVPEATRTWTAFEKTQIRPEGVHNERHIHKKIADSTFLYLYSFNQLSGEARHMVLEEERADRLYRIVRAGRALYADSTDSWQLQDVTERYILPGGQLQVFQRQTLDTVLLLTPEDIHRRPNQTDMLTNSELEETIALERQRGSEFVDDLILERYERSAYPFTTLILTAMGVAVSTRKRRGGIGLQLGIGLLLSFTFIILTFLTRVIVGDSLPPGLAMWMPNLIFAGLAIFLLRIAPK